jgi:type III secretory pathway component EscU
MNEVIKIMKYENDEKLIKLEQERHELNNFDIKNNNEIYSYLLCGLIYTLSIKSLFNSWLGLLILIQFILIAFIRFTDIKFQKKTLLYLCNEEIKKERIKSGRRPE